MIAREQQNAVDMVVHRVVNRRLRQQVRKLNLKFLKKDTLLKNTTR